MIQELTIIFLKMMYDNFNILVTRYIIMFIYILNIGGNYIIGYTQGHCYRFKYIIHVCEVL